MRVSSSQVQPVLRPLSSAARWRVFLWASRRWRWPFALLSSAVVAWLAPGLLGVWFAVLFVLFALLPRPWQVQRPAARRVWSPAGQRALRQQRPAVRPARVYQLWSAAQWQARSASRPWAPRRRFFSRGPA